MRSPIESAPRAASTDGGLFRQESETQTVPTRLWREAPPARSRIPLARYLPPGGLFFDPLPWARGTAPTCRSPAHRSHRYRCLDRGVALIVGDLEVLEPVIEERVSLPPDHEPRERKRRARELGRHLLQVIEIEMAVTTGPHEIADAKIALLRDQVGEQRIGRDVEGHPQENIAAPLVELARQLAAGDVELEQQVAGRKLHPRNVRDVPRRDQEASRVRISADFGENVRHLVDVLPIRCGPASPLIAVDRPELAVRV